MISVPISGLNRNHFGEHVSTNMAEAIMAYVMNSIRNFDDESLDKGMDSIDLIGMERKYTDEMLWLLLRMCMDNNNRNAVGIILQQWNRVLPPELYAEIYSYIFTFQVMDVDVLAFVVESLKDLSLQEIADDLIHVDKSPHVELALNKAYEIFGEQPENTWRGLAEVALTKENYNAYDYFRYRQAKVSKYAKIPNWVSNWKSFYCSDEAKTMRNRIEDKLLKILSEGQVEEISFEHVNSIRKRNERINKICDKDEVGLNKEDLPYSSDIVVPKIHISNKKPKTINEIVGIVTTNSKLLGHSQNKTDELEHRVRRELSGLGKKEIMAWSRKFLAETHLLQLQWDPEFFRVYGPCHPFYGSSPESLKLGGSRMFYSNEYDHDENGLRFDWFTGHCETCLKRIRRRWHSVRKPMPIGGWKGTFCSWNCCRESITENELICHRYIDFFEKQINRIKIQDRLDIEYRFEQGSIYDDVSKEMDFSAHPGVLEIGLCSITGKVGNDSVRPECNSKECDWVMDNNSLFKILSEYYSQTGETEETEKIPNPEKESAEQIMERLVQRCEKSKDNEKEEQVCRIK